MKVKNLFMGILILVLLLITNFWGCEEVNPPASSPAAAGNNVSLDRAAICSPSTAITVPFTRDGTGEFCWETANLCNNINSWNLSLLEINGTDYTNRWSFGSSIAKVNNKYVIHYVSTVAWGHFEIGGSCGSSGTTAPTVAPTRTTTRTATRTTVQTPTRTTTPTRTATGSTQFSSCDQWAQWNNGGYIVYNNIWGSGAGSQCLWANSYGNWGVKADHPDTGGIKSYPNSTRPDINRKLSALNTCTSSFSCTVPGSGAYTTAYDIWCDNNAYEIMLWMNKQGAVGPIAQAWDSNGNPVPSASNISVGGHTWNVYRGSNGSNTVISFVRSNTNSATIDIKAILNWIRSQGWFGDVTLGYVQLGFEITSAPGNLSFTINNYSVTVN